MQNIQRFVSLRRELFCATPEHSNTVDKVISQNRVAEKFNMYEKQISKTALTLHGVKIARLFSRTHSVYINGTARHFHNSEHQRTEYNVCRSDL